MFLLFVLMHSIPTCSAMWDESIIHYQVEGYGISSSFNHDLCCYKMCFVFICWFCLVYTLFMKVRYIIDICVCF